MKLLTFSKDPIRKYFSHWDEMSQEDRLEVREAFANKNKNWAHRKLVQKFGLDCDGRWCGCNSFSPAEIADARDYGDD